jgi:hypothetical protein
MLIETLRLVAMIVSPTGTHHGDKVVEMSWWQLFEVEIRPLGGSDWKSKMDGRAAS